MERGSPLQMAGTLWVHTKCAWSVRAVVGDAHDVSCKAPPLPGWHYVATTPTPMSVASVPFPPKSIMDAKSLPAYAPHEFPVYRREWQSSPHCQCRLTMLVPNGLSDREVAAGLLTVLYTNLLDQQLDDYGGDGDVVVFGIHRPSDVGMRYTAGAVHLYLSRGKHALEIDTGNWFSGKRYQFSY